MVIWYARFNLSGASGSTWKDWGRSIAGVKWENRTLVFRMSKHRSMIGRYLHQTYSRSINRIASS